MALQALEVAANVATVAGGIRDFARADDNPIQQELHRYYTQTNEYDFSTRNLHYSQTNNYTTQNIQQHVHQTLQIPPLIEEQMSSAIRTAEMEMSHSRQDLMHAASSLRDMETAAAVQMVGMIPLMMMLPTFLEQGRQEDFQRDLVQHEGARRFWFKYCGTETRKMALTEFAKWLERELPSITEDELDMFFESLMRFLQERHARARQRTNAIEAVADAIDVYEFNEFVNRVVRDMNLFDAAYVPPLPVIVAYRSQTREYGEAILLQKAPHVISELSKKGHPASKGRALYDRCSSLGIDALVEDTNMCIAAKLTELHARQDELSKAMPFASKAWPLKEWQQGLEAAEATLKNNFINDMRHGSLQSSYHAEIWLRLGMWNSNQSFTEVTNYLEKLYIFEFERRMLRMSWEEFDCLMASNLSYICLSTSMAIIFGRETRRRLQGIEFSAPRRNGSGNLFGQVVALEIDANGCMYAALYASSWVESWQWVKWSNLTRYDGNVCSIQ